MIARQRQRTLIQGDHTIRIRLVQRDAIGRGDAEELQDRRWWRRARRAVASSRPPVVVAPCLAMAVAGLGAGGKTIIEGSECVGASYPDFWKHFGE